MAHKNRRVGHCPTCGRRAARDPDGSCTTCRLERQRIERRARREREHAADRQRLGLQPMAKGPALVQLSIDAAIHWAAVSGRAGNPLPDTVVLHLDRARRALEDR